MYYLYIYIVIFVYTYIHIYTEPPLQATTTPFKGRKVYFAISVHHIGGEW